MQLVWYHGTTDEVLNKIKQEGVLFGVRNTPSRCTYLASELSTAKEYGDVILQVNYNPAEGDNNYCDDCWQMRVYEPIPIKNITILTRECNLLDFYTAASENLSHATFLHLVKKAKEKAGV